MNLSSELGLRFTPAPASQEQEPRFCFLESLLQYTLTDSWHEGRSHRLVEQGAGTKMLSARLPGDTCVLE